MTVTVRVEPIDRDVELIVSELLTPKAQSAQIAMMARELLQQAEQTNKRAFGFIPPHTTTVDGRSEAPLETVRTNGGIILFEFALAFEAVLAIWQMLRDKSPVGPPPAPAYRENHLLFVDGVQADPKGVIPAGREYVFLNPVPYARKIELGKMRMKVPGSSKVYAQTEQLAKRRFGRFLQVKFTWRAISGRDRSPALVIKLKGS